MIRLNRSLAITKIGRPTGKTAAPKYVRIEGVGKVDEFAMLSSAP